MYAEIIDTGQRIEVVGFVHHSRITWAVWRDDHGLLFEVPSYAIRMLPNVTDSVRLTKQDAETLGVGVLG
jgi:hypothetical protein